jgi:hypothetical protein
MLVPIKAAAVIIHIASLDEPPLRLLLGSDAVHITDQNDKARIESDRTWRDVSMSSDFEAGGAPAVLDFEEWNERRSQTNLIAEDGNS